MTTTDTTTGTHHRKPWTPAGSPIEAAVAAMITAGRAGLARTRLILTDGLPRFEFATEGDAREWAAYGVFVTSEKPEDTWVEGDDGEITMLYGFVAGVGFPMPWTVEIEYPTPAPESDPVVPGRHRSTKSDPELLAAVERTAEQEFLPDELGDTVEMAQVLDDEPISAPPATAAVFTEPAKPTRIHLHSAHPEHTYACEGWGADLSRFDNTTTDRWGAVNCVSCIDEVRAHTEQQAPVSA